ncbi:MAG: hypothetical protein K8F25_03980, partial [Fimbriimonadaceae bacterium]|nr:hypothetical protein [Alphaproteobacteria bacterium]
ILVIGIASFLTTPTPRWLIQFAAGSLVVLAAGLLDWATWDYPFQSILKNFAINVFGGKAASFGAQPFLWYLLLIANAWVGFVVPMVCFILVGARRSPLLFLIPVVILISHSFIAHKEYRFLYPALPFALILASVGASELYSLATKNLSIRGRRNGFLLMCFGWLITSTVLAGHNGFRGNFVKHVGQIAAFDSIRDDKNICGIGLVGVSWVNTPGYSTLNRNIPIYLSSNIDQANELSESFNAVLYRDDSWHVHLDGYQIKDCKDGICLATRPGTCIERPEQTVNNTLERRGE